jgi:hypothetical protein
LLAAVVVPLTLRSVVVVGLVAFLQGLLLSRQQRTRLPWVQVGHEALAQMKQVLEAVATVQTEETLYLVL